ncbi:DUF3293 domain-containing protein [Azohydromonas caseinilytica]|uniref:DUF3293 domain-containing protein n=1 Tax=Azohydromonas caseinilytica TaxID=2728836 RepID=A0A848F8J2_9BURK|nr:DUF3293 domain-containing protein [Azohydromonas caseinilytica]NML14839.1 DUF3293 domain-containing protein [Azohydromonas caseinilytica]
MKPTIRARIPGDKLHHAVPRAYHEALRKATRPEAQYSLLLFAHAPRDVVPSPPVRKALRRLGEPAPDGVVAVGTVFTEEALKLLDEAGARVVAYRKSRWTDESARQRQLKPGGIGPAPQGKGELHPPALPPCLDDAALHSCELVLAHACAYTDAAAPDEEPGGVPAEADPMAPADADDLLAGYANTNYFVAGLDAPLHPGDRNPALAGFLAGQGARSLAVLTAYNPRSQMLSLEENARRQGALRAALEAAGLRCVEAEGRARDGSARPVEPLLAVFDAPPLLLQRLMEEFGQNAVLLAAADAPPRLWLRPTFMRELAREEYASS